MSLWKGISTGAAATGAVMLAWNKWQDKNNNADDCINPKVSKRYQDISSLGLPSSGGTDRTLSNVVLHYNHQTKIPMWVQQHLSQDALEGTASRDNIRFHSDESVDDLWRAHNNDYRNSGWSRGHMAAAADNKKDMVAMTESHLFSNIVPQNYDNNSDYWNRIELYCRDIAHKYSSVWVTSGPAFLPTQKDDKNIIKYEVIGKNEVAVPTHLYKVIVTEDNKGDRLIGAFMLPNSPIRPADQPLKNFQVKLEDLEKRVGFKFYERLDRSKALDLCDVDGCKMMTQLELNQFVCAKQISRVKNREALDKIWNKIKNKNIPVTKDMQAAYEDKLADLSPLLAAQAA